jgi:hypothetical protein
VVGKEKRGKEQAESRQVTTAALSRARGINSIKRSDGGEERRRRSSTGRSFRSSIAAVGEGRKCCM